jgi:hypothetical protein
MKGFLFLCEIQGNIKFWISYLLEGFSMSDKQISRRELLKVLTAAAGGITATAFLPSGWIKPVVKSGVLPVHAQTSAASVACTQLSLFAAQGHVDTVDKKIVMQQVTLDPHPKLGLTVKYVIKGAEGLSITSNATGSATVSDTDGQVDLTGTPSADYSGTGFFTITYTITGVGCWRTVKVIVS